MIVLGPDDALRYPMYPAYIFSVDNEKKEKVKVGYIYLDTFSPADAMQAFLDFKETLSKFKAKCVKSIVIDTINNGGGSLGLGIALAQTLSKKKLELPGIQLRLSDSWLLEFREQADNPGYNPTVKRLKQMAYDSLEKDIADGRWLSSPLPIEALGDFTSWIDTYNSPGSETKIVVLVNEMCASMCDIFSAIMQDNKRAVIMGAQSMGAGGNVVNHSSSPRTNFQVRQTESLITRNNGSYIENNGTTPDIELVVNTDAKNKYSNIINKALAEAAKSNEVVIQPVPAPAPAEVAQN